MMYCKFCDKLTTELSPRSKVNSVKEKFPVDASDPLLSYCPKCHLVYAE